MKWKIKTLFLSSTRSGKASDARNEIVSAALQTASSEVDTMGRVKSTLLQLHNGLGYLMYDTVEKKGDSPGSGIGLVDRTRLKRLTCAQGKQAKNLQSKKATGAHSTIDRISGIICSDLKGPMTPLDRNGNRCMINFVDQASKYCGIFVAR